MSDNPNSLPIKPESPFADLATLATMLCQAPIARISLVEPFEHWSTAAGKVPVCAMPCDCAFCDHAMLQGDILEVPDTLTDVWFAAHPLVTGSLSIRFYVATPLVSAEGHVFGILCLMDQVSRRLTSEQRQALFGLGRQAVNQLELLLHNRQLKESLAAQKQSEPVQARLLFALDHAIDGIALLDQSGSFTYINRAYAAIFGYEPEELIGETWKELYGPEWVAQIETVFFPMLSGRGHWHGEAIGRTKVGPPVFTEMSLALFPEHNKKDHWLLWTCRDQTAQKAARDASLDAQARLLAVLDAATEVSIIAMDLEGTITVFNRGAEWMLAYDADEMIGNHTPLVLHLPSEIESRGRELSEHCGRPIEGFNVLVEEVKRGTHEEREWTYLRKDGQQIPVTLLVTAMRDASGYITGYLGIAKDLTESKQAEAALRDSEERLRLAADAAGVAVWDWDIRSGVITWDAGIFAMYGVPPTPDGQVKYEDWSTRVHPDDLAEQEAHLRHIVSTRGRGRREFRIVRRFDQAVRIIHAAETVLVGRDGHTIRVVGINIDITEQKTAQLKLEQAALEMEARNLELAENRDRALAATKAKSEFLATMSHEIRTPMNAIIGMADLLQETALSQVQQEYVDRFSRAAAGLLELITDILDLSKIEAGHLDLESISFDLHDLIDRTAESMAVRAHAKQIELIAFVHPDVPACVLGDPTRLRQILVNLTGNAVKFTELGQVTLTVERANDHAVPGALRFSIADTGIGIPEDKVGAIFESFTQVDSSTTRTYGGTGLGLSISKRIVELMGSHIEVASAVGHGSTFSFVLHMTEGSPPDSPRVLPDLGLEGLRILVVDDNATHRMIVREHLSRQGALILESPDAASALAALDRAQQRDEPIHLVILDCLLPDRHGMELAHAIRQRPDGAAIPLVIHTAEVRRAIARRDDQLNIAGYVYKPISKKRLLASVSMALRQAPIAPVPQPATHAHPEPPDQPPLAILLVEDLEDNRDLIELFLKGLPYRLDMADNGAVGVQKFQTGSYGLVFMDIQMPVMDGYQATSAIRAWEREHRKDVTPIIALTANAFKEDIEKSQAAGFTTHLTKPIKKQILLEAIRRYACMNPSKEAA